MCCQAGGPWSGGSAPCPAFTVGRQNGNRVDRDMWIEEWEEEEDQAGLDWQQQQFA